MRKISAIVIHCSAGHSDAKSVQNYFLRPKSKGGRGWNTGGYHIIIDKDGTINQFYPFNKITNGGFALRKAVLAIPLKSAIQSSKSKRVFITYING